jgi:hypothetical protein
MKNAIIAAAVVSAISMATAAVAQGPTIPTKMCDAGMFLAGSETYSFEDIIVEGSGALDLNAQGPVIAYGYVAGVDLGKEANDPIHATISTVDICYEQLGVVQTQTKLRVDLVITNDDFDATAWKDMRRAMLRLDENTLNANALVKLTGQFGVYSNTYGLYFHVKSLDVLATFKQ